MASAGSFERKTASAVRPVLSQLQPASGGAHSPHTPKRLISSTFSSPAASYRSEEDILVFQFDTRSFRAGFGGESAPRCILSFGPENCRRVGDYRQWNPTYGDRGRNKVRANDWGREYELWQMDLREVDLGLVGDKIERAVQEAYTKYLLLDTKARKIAIVLPSVLPLPLLSSILSTLFNSFQSPVITLLSKPTMAVVAAGLRSGLVIDIGWEETVFTSIYEYREIRHLRTTRAMKMVTLHMAKVLQAELIQERGHSFDVQKTPEKENEPLIVTFEHAEEVTTRLAWCRHDAQKPDPEERLAKHFDTLEIPESPVPVDSKTSKEDRTFTIPLLSPSAPAEHVPFNLLCSPVETALFANGRSSHDLDDHEQTLPYLLYKSLLSLPPDVRGICMSRIILTGDGSNIPGLKMRLLDELSKTVQHRGWDHVWGRATDKHHRRARELATNLEGAASETQTIRKSTERNGDPPKDAQSVPAAAFEPQVPDQIEDKLRRDEAKGTKPLVSGLIRGVETLGAWAGATLVAGLRIKGIVEIERDSFLQHGLAAAKKGTDPSVVHSRQSFGPGMPSSGVEKVGWTLGQWA